MNQQNQHTPTPWSYQSLPALSQDWFSVADADGTEVARIPHVVGESPAETRERAAHIVHCVNLHASLVAENKRLRGALEEAAYNLHSYQAYASEMAKDGRGHIPFTGKHAFSPESLNAFIRAALNPEGTT